jgi:hypothetical protein
LIEIYETALEWEDVGRFDDLSSKPLPMMLPLPGDVLYCAGA